MLNAELVCALSCAIECTIIYHHTSTLVGNTAHSAPGGPPSCGPDSGRNSVALSPSTVGVSLSLDTATAPLKGCSSYMNRKEGEGEEGEECLYQLACIHGYVQLLQHAHRPAFTRSGKSFQLGKCV